MASHPAAAVRTAAEGRRRDAAEPLSISSGELTLEHYRGGWGDFVVKVNGTEMAAGYQAELIGWMLDDQPQWLSLQKADFTCDRGPAGEIVCRAVLTDSANGRWQVTRRFGAGTRPGTISVETEFVVDQDRDVVHLPWLTLFPGLGTFGERKTQGLFAGLEYLDDEPSSSEADITTPEHIRRVPDPVKITFPLMAIAHGGPLHRPDLGAVGHGRGRSSIRPTGSSTPGPT